MWIPLGERCVVVCCQVGEFFRVQHSNAIRSGNNFYSNIRLKKEEFKIQSFNSSIHLLESLGSNKSTVPGSCQTKN